MTRKPAEPDLDDSDLLRRSKRGDEAAFIALYRRHQGPVFRFALHMSGRQETAEEVTQEVFLALLAHTQQYLEERGSLEAYLIGMARNQVRRHLQHVQRIVGEPKACCGESVAPGCALIDELSKEQELESLRAAILSLPHNYREVVVLCDLEGMDYQQAAMQLGCAIGTIKSRLSRARAILEAKLRKGERCPA